MQSVQLKGVKAEVPEPGNVDALEASGEKDANHMTCRHVVGRCTLNSVRAWPPTYRDHVQEP